jgi:hypothetical protein
MNETARRNQALSARPVSDRNVRTGAAFKQALAELGYDVDDLLRREPYLVTVNYAAFIACQAEVDQAQSRCRRLDAQIDPEHRALRLLRAQACRAPVWRRRLEGQTAAGQTMKSEV